MMLYNSFEIRLESSLRKISVIEILERE